MAEREKARIFGTVEKKAVGGAGLIFLGFTLALEAPWLGLAAVVGGTALMKPKKEGLS